MTESMAVLQFAVSHADVTASLNKYRSTFASRTARVKIQAQHCTNDTPSALH